MAWSDVAIPAVRGIFMPAQSPVAGTTRNPQLDSSPIPKPFSSFRVWIVPFFQLRQTSLHVPLHSTRDEYMTPRHLTASKRRSYNHERPIAPGCAGLWAGPQIRPLCCLQRGFKDRHPPCPRGLQGSIIAPSLGSGIFRNV